MESTIRGQGHEIGLLIAITPGPLLHSRNSRPASKTSPGLNPRND